VEIESSKSSEDTYDECFLSALGKTDKTEKSDSKSFDEHLIYEFDQYMAEVIRGT
jgi:hypothetical protein